MKISGVWLPIVTPFRNGEVDYESFGKLIDYYLGKGISGLIPLGTTGESPVIEPDEYGAIVEFTLQRVNRRIPVFAGLGGNYTRQVVQKLKKIEKIKPDGILSVCPYYNRPGQEGIYQHFKEIAGSTHLDIIVYNIPYRTGVNMSNETLFRLAELKNIVAVKDSCGISSQSFELLYHKPFDFSVLTGEDYFFYTSLVHGADGGILAASHLHTEKFVAIYDAVLANDHQCALSAWKGINGIIPFLFKEPNPAPIKYCLKKLGLIFSDEVRLPLTGITDELKRQLDKLI